MTSATKIVGTGAGAVWCLLFVIMLALTFGFGVASPSLVSIAFVVVPAVVAAVALWIAFRSEFRSEKLALAIELVLSTAGATCLLIVAAASGG